MTGHQDCSDVRQRRRVDRLRAELGLSPIPPHVGTELRGITPRVSEQVVRVLRNDSAFAALSPGGQTLLLSAIPRAMDEFARLVEDRPPPAPPVETMLLELAQTEGELELVGPALHAASQTLQGVARVLWPQLPQARPHSSRLDVALTRYAKGLCERTMKVRRAPASRSTGDRSAGGPHIDGLLSLVEQRWGTQPVQLYVSVSTPGAALLPALRGSTPRQAPRALSFVATDHVVTITRHSIQPPRPDRVAHPPVVVCVGPVPIDEVGQVYDIALLMLRLIRAGVAAPPSEPIDLPNLGFLHPCPDEATVTKIRELLRPLIEQRCHRRSVLARTLQLCLRTAATAQGLSKQLRLHPQTVHNHIAALRACYNTDLDFAEDGIAIQAALDLVLPLWELEATGRTYS